MLEFLGGILVLIIIGAIIYWIGVLVLGTGIFVIGAFLAFCAFIGLIMLLF